MKKDWKEKTENLTQHLGYAFTQMDLLNAAITHRSSEQNHNERLEFLGDAILNFIMAAELYRRFPTAREGDLTHMRAGLVKGETIAQIARELEIGKHLNLGMSEKKTGGHERSSILADALEAIIGAIYLDANLESVRSCVLRWYANRLNAVAPGASQKDPKTKLQEYLQAKHLPLPEYRVLDTGKDAHNPIFKVHCIVPLLAAPVVGIANTRRRAEQRAAESILQQLKNAE